LQSRCSSDLLSDVDLARRCLTYLLSDEFAERDEFGKHDPLKSRFYRYAASFWPHHMKGAGEDDSSAQRLLFHLLASKTHYETMTHVRHRCYDSQAELFRL
jgi:hypothetical protein